jgi:hypothetical protein
VATAKRTAPPAFLFFGVFTGFPPLLDAAKQLIVKRYGPLHPRGESAVFPFPETRAYGRTMGAGLVRQFFVVEKLWPQDGLAGVKHASLEMEAVVSGESDFPVERPINIDPGIINDCRIVLASTKDYAHRLYRGDGIWEEITLFYEKGAYRSHPWTYRDFGAPTYHTFFLAFRDELLARRK